MQKILNKAPQLEVLYDEESGELTIRSTHGDELKLIVPSRTMRVTNVMVLEASPHHPVVDHNNKFSTEGTFVEIHWQSSARRSYWRLCVDDLLRG